MAPSLWYKKSPYRSKSLGVPGGIRTPDFLLRRQALYPLSYRHTQQGYYTQSNGAVKVGFVLLRRVNLGCGDAREGHSES